MRHSIDEELSMQLFGRLFSPVFFATLFVMVTATISTVNASPQPVYHCEVKPLPQLQRDGYTMGESIYILNDDMVGLEAYPEASGQLPRVKSGSGERFSNGSITFAAKGDEGFLELEDGTTFPCRSVRSLILAPAISLGSVARDAPSRDGRKIESLQKGEPVSLLGEAGNYINDFQWFKVRYSDGIEAYIWGGTLCVDTELAGILIDCKRYAGKVADNSQSAILGEEAIVTAKSLFGSKVRQDADSQAKQVASLTEGAPIEIIAETGSFFDGWQWVKIRSTGGIEGFVWGGTICITDGKSIQGVHASCD